MPPSKPDDGVQQVMKPDRSPDGARAESVRRQRRTVVGLQSSVFSKTLGGQKPPFIFLRNVGVA